MTPYRRRSRLPSRNSSRLTWPGIFSISIALLSAATCGAGPNLTGFPFTNETLNYSIKWPTGVNLGEAHLQATRANPERWDLDLNIEAAIPGFQVNDRYHSEANADLCSANFTKQSTHGAKKVIETENVVRQTATRTTKNGGKTEIPVPDCVKDALAYLFYARRELGQGRVPPAQTVLFGAAYQVSMNYTGAQTVQMNGVPVETDRLTCSFQGPSSNMKFQMFFARDAARTPLLIRVPFALGEFSMELVR